MFGEYFADSLNGDVQYNIISAMGSLILISGRDKTWDELIDQCPHDVYHLRSYHQLSELSGHGQPWLAVYRFADFFIAWPYLLRPIGTTGLSDVTSVYGYAGPVQSAGFAPDTATLRDFWAALRETWKQQGAVTAFTRFNPLLRNSCKTFPWDDAGITPLGETVSMDLMCGEDQTQRNYHGTTRQEIGYARRAGMTTVEDEHWLRLDEFLFVYHQTMKRNGAAPEYFFDREHFQNIKRALGGRAHLMFTSLNGHVGGAGLFIEQSGFVHAHLVGTATEMLPFSPFKLMIDDVSRWARARGHTTLHLGGGRGGRSDSLFAFKSRFSKRRHEFFTGRWVLNGHAYESLCEARRQDAEKRSHVYAPDEFFPAYRAPSGPVPTNGIMKPLDIPVLVGSFCNAAAHVPALLPTSVRA